MYQRLLWVALCLFSWFANAQNTNCPGKVKVKVLITPDTRPQEISWAIVSLGGDTLKKGLANSDSVCIDSSLCIRFTIRDQGNNGLCCTHGVGFYQVFYGNQLVRSNYKFTNQETVNMGCPGCQPQSNQDQIRIYINPDRFPDEISWDLLKTNGDTLAKGKKFGDTLCVSNTECLRFTIRDSYGDGLCCNNGIGGYEIYNNQTLVASGSQYTFKDIKTFHCPPGIDCSNALTATLGDTFTTQFDDTWYRYVPDTSGQFFISTCNMGNNCNTKIWVYDYCDGLVPSEGNAGTLAYSFSGCGLQANLSIILNKNVPYYIRIGDDFNTCPNDSIRWTIGYQGPIIGCMDPASCTYNPMATVNNPALCLYNPDTACPDQPDLVVNSNLLRTSLRFDSLVNNDACYIQEGCLKGFGQRYIVRFGTQIENIGDADYYIGKPPANINTPSTQWNWDPCHGHWHYIGYAEYILYDQNSNSIPAGFKAGFCVMDLNCSFGGGTPKYNCANQGITAHCGDIYSSSLKCQWIDITDVDTGRYTLVARVNWDNSPDFLGRIESNLNNNWGQVCFRIRKNSNGRRFVDLLPNCNPYVDCDGQVFGPARRDCQGVCRGNALQGNLNGDTLRNQQDLKLYKDGILQNNLTLSACKDLNNDSKIDILDYHMLHQCIASSSDPLHAAICNFGPLIQNPEQSARISIDSVYMAEGYLDLSILNADQEVVAFQLALSGLSVDSARFIGLGDSGTVQLFHSSDGTLMGSMIGNRILRHTTSTRFLRVYFDTTTGNQVCIASISSILSANLQVLAKSSGPCKSTGNVTFVQQRLGRPGVRLIPNPFRKQTRIVFSNPDNLPHQLFLYNQSGQKVRSFQNIQGQEWILSGDGLAPGIYRFQLLGKEIRTGTVWLEK